MSLNHKDIIPRLKSLVHPQLQGADWALSFEEFLQLDFLTLTPEGFCGYEIKGENDVLTRLTAKTSKVKRSRIIWEKNEHGYYDNKGTETRTYEIRKQLGSQIEKYERICTKCSVVTTENHKEKVLETVPPHWGVFVCTETELRCEREPQLNPNLKTRSLVNVLWLQELRDLSRMYFRGYSRWSSAEHAKKLASVPNIHVSTYARVRDRFLLKEGRFDLPRHTVVKAPEKFRERDHLNGDANIG